MDLQNIELSDKLLSILVQRHEYLQEKDIKICLKVQKKLKKNNINKSLEEVFVYKEILPEPQLQDLVKFIDFFKNRLANTTFCLFAIAQEEVSKEHFEFSLITQRAIFLLKQKTTDLLEILKNKGQFPDEVIASLKDKYKALVSSELQEWIKKAERYIDEEDTKTLAHRNRNATPPPQEKKTVAKKPRKAKPESAPQRPELAQRPEAGVIVPPPSRLEEQATQEHNLGVRKPPVDIDLDMQLSQALQKQKKESSPMFAAIAVVIAVLIGVAAFLYWESTRAQSDYSAITWLLENKKYTEAETSCREFLQKHPIASEYYKKTKQNLQKLLMVRVDIAVRQENFTEAEEIMKEVVTLGETDEVVAFQRQLQDLMSHHETSQKWDSTILQIEDLLRQEQIAQAQQLYMQLQGQTPPSLQQKLQELSEAIEKAQRLSAREQYRYYSANELAKFTPAKQPDEIPVHRLFLGDLHKGTQPSTGHFFTVVHGYLYCLDATTGNPKWFEHLGNDSVFAPIFLAGPQQHYNMSIVDKVLAAAPKDNSLRLLEVQNGKHVWKCSLPSAICSAPMIFKREIYVGCLDQYCYRINLDGNIVGAYKCGGIINHSPVFDRRSGDLYLASRNAVYIYNSEGNLKNLIEHDAISAPPIPVNPYVCVLSTQQQKTKLNFYLIQNDQAKLVSTSDLPETMKTPATLSSGILAVPSGSYLGLYGLNPTNPREALFSLTGDAPLFLNGNGPLFMQFSDLGRKLFVARDKLISYTIQEFTDKSNPVQQNWLFDIFPEKTSAKYAYLPLQSAGNTFFIAHRTLDREFFGTALDISKETPKIIWHKKFGAGVEAQSSILPDGRVLFHASDGKIHEIYAKEKISHRTWEATSNGRSQPTFIPDAQGKAVLFHNNQLQLADAVTGWKIEKWRTQIPFKGELGAGACYVNGTIFFAAQEDVFGVSAKTGEKIYIEFSEFKGKPFHAIPVSYQNGLFIGCDNGTMYYLEPEAGQQPFLKDSWKFSTQGAIRTTPTIAQDCLFFGSDDGLVYAIDLKTKTLKWSFATKGEIRSQSVVDGSILYQGSNDRAIYALDVATGKQLWKQQLQGKIMASPMVYRNKLYVATISGNVFAFDKNTGKQLGKVILGGAVTSNLVVFKNYVIVPAHDGFLYFIKE